MSEKVTEVNRLEQMRGACAEFHLKHPEVWKMFVEFTNDRIARGFLHYGVSAIFERIRWEAELGADGALEFKLNNNFVAFYARRFAKMYPKHAEFFRTRTQISSTAEPAYAAELVPSDFSYSNDQVSE